MESGNVDVIDKMTVSGYDVKVSEKQLNFVITERRPCGLMVSVLDSRSSYSGSGHGRGHHFVLLGKTLYSHSASLHPRV